MALKEVVYLQLDQLQENKHQPRSRTEPHNLRDLITSIRRDNLQYPILVSQAPDGAYIIIDGHRRAAALRSDGHDMIPCIIGEGPIDHLFAVVAGTQKKLSTLDWATIFVNNGEVPTGVTKNNLTKLRDAIGVEGIKDMIERGVTPNVWNTARSVVRYAFDGDESELKPALEWLIRHKQAMNASTIITNKQSRDLIIRAIKDDQPIRF